MRMPPSRPEAPRHSHPVEGDHGLPAVGDAADYLSWFAVEARTTARSDVGFVSQVACIEGERPWPGGVADHRVEQCEGGYLDIGRR